MSALDGIRQRAEGVALWREHFMPPQSKIDFSQRDVPRLLTALDAVLEWCDTNQHPNTDYPAGFSSQDYTLDDAARRIRTAINDALEAAA